MRIISLNKCRTAASIVFALAITVGGSLQAQNPRLVDPSNDSATASEIEPESAAPAPQDQLPPEADQVLVDAIKAIVLVGKVDLVQMTPSSADGVVIKDSDLYVPDRVAGAAEPYVGQPLTLAAVQGLARDMVVGYRDSGIPVVDVVIPEQEISGGILQLLVVVGRRGEITAEGARYFDQGFYVNAVSHERGDMIESAVIMEDLRYLNRNPFRRVDLVYTPGAEFAYTDIILDVTEQRPISISAGYEDTGNDSIGRDRYQFGVEVGKIGNLDHSLAYQYTTDSEFENIHAHALSYRAPLPWKRHELRLLAGYVESDLNFDFAGEEFNSSGQSVQLSAQYLIPLKPTKWMAHDLILGYDFKSSNNNLEFGGQDVFDTNSEVHQFSATHAAEIRTGLGVTRLTNSVYWAPGEMSNHNEDAIFEESRFLGSSDYVYYRGQLYHVAFLPKDFRLAIKVDGQVSNQNLIASEQYLLGGVNSVRGYEQNLLRADQGVGVNLELYAPEFRPLGWLPFNSRTVEGSGKAPATTEPLLVDHARFFGFYDFGWGRNTNRVENEEDINLAGAGVGLDYRISNSLALRAAYGWQIAESGFDDEEDGRMHLSAKYRW